MTEYSQRIKTWLDDNNIDADLLKFKESVHSVEEAVMVSGYPVERITKSIVMLTQKNDLVIAVVCAKNRASTERVRKFLKHNERPRIATEGEIEHLTGQKAGGNSPLNASNALILIDPKVLELDWVLTGGGDDRHLIKISIEELKKVTTYTAVRIRK